MSMINSLRDVLIPDNVVGSDGWVTRVGATVRLALEFDCESWAYTDAPAPPRYDDGSGYELVGEVQPVEAGWVHGWMLGTGGLTAYVRTDDLPEGGRLVRARGRFSIAEDYVTDLFEPRDELLARACRSWRVDRIVRIGHHDRREVSVIPRLESGRRGYLLDVTGVPA
ncbi:hypothetical protein [Actinoplanes sp. DH11]|uniref:hypothetical protein n=1 Tax=Actinoplanes sp. DH11 TaxID=2857011 RepID=UPI001E289729|nr:hypothetical protein [Actinoplanes sp. DH11]